MKKNEKYFAIWTALVENCSGFLTVMNRFHTAVHQHAKQ
jgi:hypothetical protein